MDSRSVLVIGSGGREHALVWKLSQSPLVTLIYVATGNEGTRKIAQNIPIKIIDINALCSFAKQMNIDLTVVGPELPLKLGIVDLFRANSLSIFGPTAAAVRIETSKAFAKQLMLEEGIPTAPFKIFNNYIYALRYIDECEFPCVIKADGLASGKGAYICHNLIEAQIVLKDLMLNKIYGDSGHIVIIEDFLHGKEISIHALCGSNKTIVFPPSRDHKKLKDNDKGLNTGGMGVFAPIHGITSDMMLHVKHHILQPTLYGLQKRNIPFTGCLYPGLLEKNVLEFNARFGDPETQVYMRLIDTDLYLLLKSYADSNSEDIPVSFRNEYCVCIAACSEEYPLPMSESVPIVGISRAENLSEKVVVFHGSTICKNEKIHAYGGRILYITATGNTLLEARTLAYHALEFIYFKGMQYRTDIAKI